MATTFSSAERELLLEILEEHHRELLREISRTKHHDYKIVLRQKVSLLESMVKKTQADEVVEQVLQPL